MFRDGVFRPRDIWTDEEWRGRCSEGQCEWLGWMIERSRKLKAEMAEAKFMEAMNDWANGGGPLPDDFSKRNEAAKGDD